MSLPVPAYVSTAPWPGVYPGDGVPGMSADAWIEAFCALYLDSGKHLQDWEAWRINALANVEAQIESLSQSASATNLDASVA